MANSHSHDNRAIEQQILKDNIDFQAFRYGTLAQFFNAKAAQSDATDAHVSYAKTFSTMSDICQRAAEGKAIPATAAGFEKDVFNTIAAIQKTGDWKEYKGFFAQELETFIAQDTVRAERMHEALAMFKPKA